MFDDEGGGSGSSSVSLDVEPTELHSQDDQLTPGERTALGRALRLGYFDVPRAGTLTDVAADLGRSDVTVSRQIRRGTATVLRSADVLVEPSLVAADRTDRTLDGLFGTLAHPYRRRVLLRVAELDPDDERGVAVEETTGRVEGIGDVERGGESRRATADARAAHLAWLADAGYVEWDEERRRLRRGPTFEAVGPALDLVEAYRAAFAADGD
jgi:hypothetical protein